MCVAGDKLFVYHCAGGVLGESFVFDASEAGLAQFRRYLAENGASPVYLLVDVVEEEYRQETVPHVRGRDRKTVLERKRARLFRGTPYVYTQTQGREREGRRDDRVLLTALMNPAAVKPWVEALNEARVPLAGIYSLPALSTRLLKKLQLGGENVLLVSLQSASGLRQSFFRNGELRVSRLAKMPRLGTVPFADYLLGELEKLRRYLNSLRLVSRDHPLDIYVLSNGEPLEHLRRHCSDSEYTRYHLLDVVDVEEKLGVDPVKATPFSDRLFAHLLLATRPVNQYASAGEIRYFRLHNARIGTLAASVALLLGSAALSGLNFVQGIALKQEAFAAEQRAAYYQERYDLARQNLPATAVEPAAIQAAVEAVETLVHYRASPVPLMRVVGRSLAGFPELELDVLRWGHGADPRRDISDSKGSDRVSMDTPEDAPAYPYYHIARIEGRVGAFAGDYRRALAQVNGLAEALRAEEAVYHVKVLRQPLDLSSDARLEGSAEGDSGAGAVSFSIRLVMGVEHGKS